MPTPAAARRDVLTTAWPVVLQSLLRTTMFFVDTAMLGHYGVGGLASMGFAGPMVFTIMGLLGALGVGALATTARAWGEGDRAKVEGEAAAALAAAVVVGLLAGAAGVLGFPPAVAAMASVERVPPSPAVFGDAAAYLRIIACALPFAALEVTGSSVLRACGDTRTPLWIAAVANVANAAGNYAFIFGHWGAPAMGVRGAALSTAFMMTAQGLATWAVLLAGAGRVRIRFAALREVTRERLARLARVTGPAVVEPLILQTGFLVFVVFVNGLGDAANAAHRVAVSVESLSFMPGYGFSLACAALVGQRLGARDPAGAARRCREAVRLSVLVMGALGVVFAATPGLLVVLFVSHDDPHAAELTRLAAVCLSIGAFEQPALGAAMTLQGALRGAGDTRSPVFVAALGVWGVRVPLVILLTVVVPLGLAGVWLTTVADWTVRAAASAWIYRRGRWKDVRL